MFFKNELFKSVKTFYLKYLISIIKHKVYYTNYSELSRSIKTFCTT